MSALSLYVAHGGENVAERSTSNSLASSAAALLLCDQFEFDMKLATRMKLIQKVGEFLFSKSEFYDNFHEIHWRQKINPVVTRDSEPLNIVHI